MARADLLVVNASNVATLRGPARARRGRELGRLAEVRRGALAIRDGVFVGVGRTPDLRSKFTAAETLDVEGRAIVPGFVDAHTHLPFAGSRAFELDLKLAGKSYLDILRAGGGIHRTVADTRAVSLKDLLGLVLERLDVMLRWGTTTAEAKSGYGLRLEDEIKQLRAVQLAQGAQPMDLVPTFLGAHVVPKEFARKRGEYVRLLTRKMVPAVARERLAEFCDVFLERDAFTAKECETILTEARRAGLGLKLHADEFTNGRGAELAARLGCVSAEHLLHVSPKGIRALAKTGTIATLLPGVSVTGLLDRFAPARRMVDAGCAVALGTDFNPNCHVLTMPTVLQWAVYHLRLTPSEALAAATINAAYSVGRGDRTGSLEVGKRADFVVLDYETVTDLAYRVGTNPVWFVSARGHLYGSANLAKPQLAEGR
jgi:imidazolonepropionase